MVWTDEEKLLWLSCTLLLRSTCGNSLSNSKWKQILPCFKKAILLDPKIKLVRKRPENSLIHPQTVLSSAVLLNGFLSTSSSIILCGRTALCLKSQFRTWELDLSLSLSRLPVWLLDGIHSLILAVRSELWGGWDESLSGEPELWLLTTGGACRKKNQPGFWAVIWLDRWEQSQPSPIF